MRLFILTCLLCAASCAENVGNGGHQPFFFNSGNGFPSAAAGSSPFPGAGYQRQQHPQFLQSTPQFGAFRASPNGQVSPGFRPIQHGGFVPLINRQQQQSPSAGAFHAPRPRPQFFDPREYRFAYNPVTGGQTVLLQYPTISNIINPAAPVSYFQHPRIQTNRFNTRSPVLTAPVHNFSPVLYGANVPTGGQNPFNSIPGGFRDPQSYAPPQRSRPASIAPARQQYTPPRRPPAIQHHQQQRPRPRPAPQRPRTSVVVPQRPQRVPRPAPQQYVAPQRPVPQRQPQQYTPPQRPVQRQRQPYVPPQRPQYQQPQPQQQQYASPPRRHGDAHEPVEQVPLGDHPISTVTHDSQKNVLDLLNLFYDIDPNTGVLGSAGKDFPTLHRDSLSSINFACSGRDQGYYADVSSGCQAYHHCNAVGKTQSFLCPNGTIYNQKNFVCEWWYNVDCSTSESYYNRNSQLYADPKTKAKKDDDDQKVQRGYRTEQPAAPAGRGGYAAVPRRQVHSTRGQQPQYASY